MLVASVVRKAPLVSPPRHCWSMTTMTTKNDGNTSGRCRNIEAVSHDPNNDEEEWPPHFYFVPADFSSAAAAFSAFGSTSSVYHHHHLCRPAPQHQPPKSVVDELQRHGWPCTSITTPPPFQY
jgi:hypothetical protein